MQLDQTICFIWYSQFAKIFDFRGFHECLALYNFDSYPSFFNLLSLSMLNRLK